MLGHIDLQGEIGIAGAGGAEMLGAKPKGHPVTRLGGGGQRQGEARAALVDQLKRNGAATGGDDLGRHEIHLGRADKAGDELVGRVVVEIQRAPDLFDDAVAQHDDGIGERHGLDLVVGDVDDGGLQFLVEARDLDAHVHPQLGIEVGQGLVEQEDLRIAHDGAADGDALTLAARELLGIAIKQRVERQDFGGLVHLPGDLVLGHFGKAQRKAHVVAHRHMRVKGIGLEHHGDAAP